MVARWAEHSKRERWAVIDLLPVSMLILGVALLVFPTISLLLDWFRGFDV
jgi:uncharacterized membrane protein HdeD (DUF308 family)